MLNELENQAAACVGQLIFAFSRLDFLLALALQNLTPTPSPDQLNPLIERLGFKDKLDCLQELVNGSEALSHQAVQTFFTWQKSADKVRITRNAFVHGRWGMQTRNTLFNASPKVGRALSGEAKLYTLDELKAEAIFATQVLNEFYEWHKKHVLNQ
ncbi:hypothetical protein SAMN05660284_01284 [Formivibrio citricus]|uniref:RiboL-PSP-HEPN domain-containing protein n=1 Tax=Formivibrio citricus TaxID=83765 RepID=A0A1I4YAD4_9NEIS|nr:hypothetical protein [Formivibrio citricus]SFN34955.1 hypothetical protein SAMN05660284_01284 [Formivibrio citricus]